MTVENRYPQGFTNPAAARRACRATTTFRWHPARSPAIPRPRASGRWWSTGAKAQARSQHEGVLMDQLVQSTVKAAMRVAAGGSFRSGLVPERVALLAEDALNRGILTRVFLG